MAVRHPHVIVPIVFIPTSGAPSVPLEFEPWFEPRLVAAGFRRVGGGSIVATAGKGGVVFFLPETIVFRCSPPVTFVLCDSQEVTARHAVTIRASRGRMAERLSRVVPPERRRSQGFAATVRLCDAGDLPALR
jgi:hypothetical protein